MSRTIRTLLHAIINGIEERDRTVIQRFLSDGVFYVKIPGNLSEASSRVLLEL